MNNRDSISHVIHHHEFSTLMKHDVEDMRMLQTPVMGDDDPLKPRQFNWVTIGDHEDLARISAIRTNLTSVFVYKYYEPKQYHVDLKSIYLPPWVMKHFGTINCVKFYYAYKKADKIIEFLYKEYLDTIRSTRKRFDKHGITPWERMLAKELNHER